MMSAPARSTAAGSCAGYRPAASGARAPNSDDRLCTFVAGNPRAPPLAQDIYRLRLLDQEDEQQAQEQQHTSQQVGSQPFNKQLARDLMQDCVTLHTLQDRHTHLSMIYASFGMA